MNRRDVLKSGLFVLASMMGAEPALAASHSGKLSPSIFSQQLSFLTAMDSKQLGSLPLQIFKQMKSRERHEMFALLRHLGQQGQALEMSQRIEQLQKDAPALYALLRRLLQSMYLGQRFDKPLEKLADHPGLNQQLLGNYYGPIASCGGAHGFWAQAPV